MRSRHSGNAVQALPTSSEPGPAKFVRADLVCQPALMIHPLSRELGATGLPHEIGRASMARQGKGVLRGKPAARKASKQQAISQVGLLPELKKPAEAIGKFISLPGSFWEGRLSSEEKSALFKCAVVQFSAVHTFADGHKAAAFRPRATRHGHRRDGTFRGPRTHEIGSQTHESHQCLDLRLMSPTCV